jgi:hypothetical protein
LLLVVALRNNMPQAFSYKQNRWCTCFLFK